VIPTGRTPLLALGLDAVKASAMALSSLGPDAGTPPPAFAPAPTQGSTSRVPTLVSPEQHALPVSACHHGGETCSPDDSLLLSP